MEIDMVEEESTQAYTQIKSTKIRPRAPVDDMHPFDLETYISGYSGPIFAGYEL